MRDICVYQEFLTEAHKARIRETAEDLGFTPHFFTLDQFEEAKSSMPTTRSFSGRPRRL